MNQSSGLKIVENFGGEHALTGVILTKKENVKSIQSFQSVFTSERGSQGQDMSITGVHLEKE